MIEDVLQAVDLDAPEARKINTFSGGQQARLLLASALIQDPDLLLLDEPTNNLDHRGVDRLTQFLIKSNKTVLVISHDAGFLNSFTEGILYLDKHTKTVEAHHGDYYEVVKNISAKIARQTSDNARKAKFIQSKKDQAAVFAQKAGKMRSVAQRMRKSAERAEADIVEVQREDRAIKEFTFPTTSRALAGDILKLTRVQVRKEGKQVSRPVNVTLRAGQCMLLSGPNGVGKTTLLEALASGKAKGCTIPGNFRVGYYRQDFSELNYNHTVLESLEEVCMDDNRRRTVAAGFQLTSERMSTRVEHLSEGQKGLLAFCRLVLQKPDLLVLDEPTNHINFRHLPVILRALDKFAGGLLIVSHDPEFRHHLQNVRGVNIHLDLGTLL